MSDGKIICLHQDDNVGVALKDLDKGDQITHNNQEVKLNTDITFGHKIALKGIVKGEVINKYGVPIGSAKQDILAGDHVHVHNMESLYMKQFSK